MFVSPYTPDNKNTPPPENNFFLQIVSYNFFLNHLSNTFFKLFLVTVSLGVRFFRTELDPVH